jgi:hypothetical protein
MSTRSRAGGENHHTVAGSILDALGRGALIATASIIVGAMIGTSQLASLGMWLLGVSAAAGVGLVVGAALVKNAGCGRDDAEAEEPPQKAEVLTLVTAMPVVLEPEAASPAERRRAYAELVTGDGQHQHGHGR